MLLHKELYGLVMYDPTTIDTAHQPGNPGGGFGENVAKLLQIHPVALGSGLVSLTPGEFVIGRDVDCSLQIPESAVSRKHASIEKTEDGDYMIRDLDSTNGTWVNRTSVQAKALKTGDKLRIGNRVFKFIPAQGVEADYFDAVYSMMTKDGLTGALNRSMFLDMFEGELKRRRRSGASMCLLMIDVDKFKSINDTYGHPAGDEVLVEMVRRLQSQSRDEDLLARFGGEEFAAILSSTSKKQGIQVAERWRAVVSQEPIQTKAGSIECSISIGIAAVQENQSNVNAEELLKIADRKLYEAKRSGRNVVVW